MPYRMTPSVRHRAIEVYYYYYYYYFFIVSKSGVHRVHSAGCLILELYYLPNRDSGLEYIGSAENLHAIRNKKA